MVRRWTDSVLDALRRFATRHGTQIIRRPQLIAEELTTIVSETGSRGRTPEQTLNRTLQMLRDKGLLEFGPPGAYRLVAAPHSAGSSTASGEPKDGPPSSSALLSGDTHSWESLGARFDFAPDYLGAAGGMISRPKHNALLIMTHPGGAKSFDYGDYWDNRDLIYAGRGKLGDQRLQGQNRDLAENHRIVLAFEPAGPRRLRFLGRARCVEHWWTREPDQSGRLRRVLRYRLR